MGAGIGEGAGAGELSGTGVTCGIGVTTTAEDCDVSASGALGTVVQAERSAANKETRRLALALNAPLYKTPINLRRRIGRWIRGKLVTL